MDLRLFVVDVLIVLLTHEVVFSACDLKIKTHNRHIKSYVNDFQRKERQVPIEPSRMYLPPRIDSFTSNGFEEQVYASNNFGGNKNDYGEIELVQDTFTEDSLSSNDYGQNESPSTTRNQGLTVKNDYNGLTEANHPSGQKPTGIGNPYAQRTIKNMENRYGNLAGLSASKDSLRDNDRNGERNSYGQEIIGSSKSPSFSGNSDGYANVVRNSSGQKPTMYGKIEIDNTHIEKNTENSYNIQASTKFSSPSPNFNNPSTSATSQIHNDINSRNCGQNVLLTSDDGQSSSGSNQGASTQSYEQDVFGKPNTGSPYPPNVKNLYLPPNGPESGGYDQGSPSNGPNDFGQNQLTTPLISNNYGQTESQTLSSDRGNYGQSNSVPSTNEGCDQRDSSNLLNHIGQNGPITPQGGPQSYYTDPAASLTTLSITGENLSQNKQNSHANGDHASSDSRNPDVIKSYGLNHVGSNLSNQGNVATTQLRLAYGQDTSTSTPEINGNGQINISQSNSLYSAKAGSPANSGYGTQNKKQHSTLVPKGQYQNSNLPSQVGLEKQTNSDCKLGEPGGNVFLNFAPGSQPNQQENHNGVYGEPGANAFSNFAPGNQPNQQGNNVGDFNKPGANAFSNFAPGNQPNQQGINDGGFGKPGANAFSNFAPGNQPNQQGMNDGGFGKPGANAFSNFAPGNQPNQQGINDGGFGKPGANAFSNFAPGNQPNQQGINDGGFGKPGANAFSNFAPGNQPNQLGNNDGDFSKPGANAFSNFAPGNQPNQQGNDGEGFGIPGANAFSNFAPGNEPNQQGNNDSGYGEPSTNAFSNFAPGNLLNQP